MGLAGTSAVPTLSGPSRKFRAGYATWAGMVDGPLNSCAYAT
jgi:hypothetical protein